MPARIEVLGMEVVQSIQNMKGDIPLLAHKKTAVRVYVHPSGLATIRASKTSGTASTGPCASFWMEPRSNRARWSFASGG
jgi:hypothetical protein